MDRGIGVLVRRVLAVGFEDWGPGGRRIQFLTVHVFNHTDAPETTANHRASQQ